MNIINLRHIRTLTYSHYVMNNCFKKLSTVLILVINVCLCQWQPDSLQFKINENVVQKVKDKVVNDFKRRKELFGKGKKPKKNVAEGMEARIQHLEDLVYFEGSKGAARALEGLRSLEKGIHLLKYSVLNTFAQNPAISTFFRKVYSEEREFAG